MMKKVSLFSGLLAAGMLFGTGMSVMTSHVQVRATTEATASNQNGQRNKLESQTSSKSRAAVPKSNFKLTVNEDNAKFDESTGTLSGFTQEWVDEHPDQIENLLKGGQLEIPDEINGVSVEIIGERRVHIENEDEDSPSFSVSGAFSRNTLHVMIGEDPLDGVNDSWGISAIIGGTKLTEIAQYGFSGNLIESLSMPNLEKVGDVAFDNNQLNQIDLPKVAEIGEYAFSWNQLNKISLPNVTQIGKYAFYRNQLNKISLPNVAEIGEYAFISNQLDHIELPNVTQIGDYAFWDNQLTHIELPESVILGSDVFYYQTISQNITANKDGEVPFDTIKPQLKIGDVDQIKKIANITILSPTDTITTEDSKIVGIAGKGPIKLNTKVDLEMIPDSQGDYSISSNQLTINPFEDNGGDNNNGNNGSGGDNSGGSTETGTQPDNNTNGSDNNTEVKPLPNPNKPAAAPHSVYALRGMRLHKNVSLTDPVRSYKKQARAKAANFRIEGVAYDQNGKKRYKVKGGYITASSKYVADSHFRSKKINRVRVISNRANSYKDLKLSKNQKVRSYKKGTKLNVKRIVNYGRTTRFELTNGRYISGNKQIFIMDQK